MKGARAAGRALIVAVACGLSVSCVDPGAAATTSAPPPPSTAANFQAAIAGLDRLEPNSPATLAARLDFAEFLLQDSLQRCQHLDLAKTLLEGADQNPAREVIFPGGWGRLVDLQYRRQRAHADCLAVGSADQVRELRTALDSAQRAVQLYRNSLDYRSMTVMQYNVAVTYRALGEGSSALTALENAIAMDREFGLRADALENYATLLRWREEPAGPDQVAQRMADFPERVTTPKFGWSAADASMTLETTHASVIDGALLDGRSSVVFERHVRAGRDGWIISDTPGPAHDDSGPWPRGSQDPNGPLGIFRPVLLEFPTIEVTRSGNFKGADNLVPFAARVTRDAQVAIRAQAPAGARTPGLLHQALDNARIEFAPAVIANEVSEAYGLQTAMWIGATLKQGVVYELTVPLSLPGMTHIVVDSRVAFTFTRELPCPTGAKARTCVELLLTATPLEQALQGALAEIALPAGTVVHFSSSTSMRLIVDPETLRPYLRDTQQYWYATLGRAGAPPKDVLLESNRNTFKWSWQG